jgi:hypothetical protein
LPHGGIGIRLPTHNLIFGRSRGYLGWAARFLRCAAPTWLTKGKGSSAINARSVVRCALSLGICTRPQPFRVGTQGDLHRRPTFRSYRPQTDLGDRDNDHPFAHKPGSSARKSEGENRSANRRGAMGVAREIARLHQLDTIFTFFGASDRDKRLILQVRGLRLPVGLDP